MGGQMTKVVPGLYVGSWKNATNEEELLANCITHILSVHDSRQELEKISSREYFRLRASDTPHYNLARHFSECNDFIHKGRTNGGNVLIHCITGESQSIAVTVAYLITVTDFTLQETLNALRGLKNTINLNEGFSQQLEEFESKSVEDERVRLESQFGDWSNLLSNDSIALNDAIETHKSLLDNGYYLTHDDNKADESAAGNLEDALFESNDYSTVPPGFELSDREIDEDGIPTVLGRTEPICSAKKLGLNNFNEEPEEEVDEDDCLDEDDDVPGSVPVRRTIQRFDMAPSASSYRARNLTSDNTDPDAVSFSMPIRSGFVLPGKDRYQY